jgi:hypothetical protein
MEEMNRPFVRAFEVWETECRVAPSRFMTPEDMAAIDVLPLSEQRAAYFTAILNTLAAGRPWNAI